MPDTQNTTLGNAPSPAPAGNLSLESIPIRTMKDDLKNIGTPNCNPNTPPMPSGPTKPAGNMPPMASEKQKTSPFLAPKSNIAPISAIKSPVYTPSMQPVSQPRPMTGPAPVANPFQRTINPMAAQGNVGVNVSQPESHLSLKKTFLIGGIIFIVLAGAAGGYYWWMTRQQAPVAVEPTPTEPTPVETPEAQPETPPVITPVFSIDKPNYLALDIKTADAAKIKAEIKDRTDKLVASEIKTPIEFIVSDENFNPTTFKDFAGKFGLKLSARLLANLEDKFSLFIYNDNGVAKLGLVLDAKNEKTAKTQLTQEEATLITKLTPLYLDSAFTIKDKKFASSQYGELVIRYNNLVSTSELSLDYALFGKKLLIGTSKMTLRSIYDYLKGATPTETAQPVDNLGQ